MSHIDARAEFSDAQAVTATAISTNVRDRKGAGLSPNATDNIGAPATMYLVVRTNAAATDSGSDATLAVTLESADNAALSTNPVVHYSTGAMAFATFSPANTTLAVIPLPAATYKGCGGVRRPAGEASLTAGTFVSFPTLDPNIWRAYADG